MQPPRPSSRPPSSRPAGATSTPSPTTLPAALTRALVGVLVAALVTVLAGCGSSARPPVVPEHCTAVSGGGPVDLSPEQAAVSTTIVATAIRMGVPRRAVTIAFATAMQESKLQNLHYGDRDSVGVFQQRPSQGWGTRKQILDPAYATRKFLDALLKVDGWQHMPLHRAAQHVQRSADGTAYAQHETQARIMSAALTGRTGSSGFTCVLRPDPGRAALSHVRRAVAHQWGPREVDTLGGGRFTVAVGRTAPARHALAMSFWLVAHADTFGLRTVTHAGRTWRAGDDVDHWRKATGSAGRPDAVSATFVPHATPSRTGS